MIQKTSNLKEKFYNMYLSGIIQPKVNFDKLNFKKGH